MENAYSGNNSIELSSEHPYGTGYVKIAKIVASFNGSFDNSSISDKICEAK
jgi:hypothetical protein